MTHCPGFPGITLVSKLKNLISWEPLSFGKTSVLGKPSVTFFSEELTKHHQQFIAYVLNHLSWEQQKKIINMDKTNHLRPSIINYVVNFWWGSGQAAPECATLPSALGLKAVKGLTRKKSFLPPPYLPERNWNGVLYQEEGYYQK